MLQEKKKKNTFVAENAENMQEGVDNQLNVVNRTRNAEGKLKKYL